MRARIWSLTDLQRNQQEPRPGRGQVLDKQEKEMQVQVTITKPDDKSDGQNFKSCNTQAREEDGKWVL